MGLIRGFRSWDEILHDSNGLGKGLLCWQAWVLSNVVVTRRGEGN
jgi:hypothetical protein